METPQTDLIHEYLQGTLDEAGTGRLAVMMRSTPGMRRQLAMHIVMDRMLNEIAAPAVSVDSIMNALPKEPGLNMADGVYSQILHIEREKHAGALRQGETQVVWWRAALRPALALAASIAVIAGAYAIYWETIGNRAGVGAVSAILAECTTGTTVSRNGQVLACNGGFGLLDKDEIRVSRTGRAVVAYRNEATKVVLTSGASLSIWNEAGAKRCFLKSGVINCTVAKQTAGRTMKIITSQSEAAVIGTVFSVRAQPDSTRLDVKEGLVRFTRISDGATIEVAGGSYAIAAPGVELAAVKLSTPAGDGKGKLILEEPFTKWHAGDWQFVNVSPKFGTAGDDVGKSGVMTLRPKRRNQQVLSWVAFEPRHKLTAEWSIMVEPAESQDCATVSQGVVFRNGGPDFRGAKTMFTKNPAKDSEELSLGKWYKCRVEITGVSPHEGGPRTTYRLWIDNKFAKEETHDHKYTGVYLIFNEATVHLADLKVYELEK